MDTLYCLVSMCFKNEMAPHPEPKITTLGLSSYCVSITLTVLNDVTPVFPALPTSSTEAVVERPEVEANLIRRVLAFRAGCLPIKCDNILTVTAVCCVEKKTCR